MRMLKNIGYEWYAIAALVVALLSFALYMNYRPSPWSYMNGHITSDRREQTFMLKSAQLWDPHVSIDSDNAPHVVGVIKDTSSSPIKVVEITFINSNGVTFDLQPNLTLKPEESQAFVADSADVSQRTLKGDEFSIAYKTLN